MFKTVVWATDGSEPADLALPYVERFAENGARIVVVHCEELLVTAGAGAYPLQPAEGELQGKIKGQVKHLTDEGYDAAYRLHQSPPGRTPHEIAEAAEEEGAELIVLGTRGHTALGGLFVGSVTQRLLLIGSCPVLAVPGRVATAAKTPEAAQAAAG